MLAGLQTIELIVESGEKLCYKVESVSPIGATGGIQHVVSLQHPSSARSRGASLGFPSLMGNSNPELGPEYSTPQPSPSSASVQKRPRKAKKRKKCPHNRERYRCKDCGGSSICPHNRVKSQCKDCGGSQICRVSCVAKSESPFALGAAPLG